MPNKPDAAHPHDEVLFPLTQPLHHFAYALNELLADASLEDVAALTGLRPLAIRQHLSGLLAPTAAERAAYAAMLGFDLPRFDAEVRLWSEAGRYRLDISRALAERLDQRAMSEGVTIEQWIERVAREG